MTLDEVVEAGECAFRQLRRGLLLRYEPADGSVRILACPTTPSSCRAAPEYLGVVPEASWSHPGGCGPRRCPGRAYRGVVARSGCVCTSPQPAAGGAPALEMSESRTRLPAALGREMARRTLGARMVGLEEPDASTLED